MSEQTRDEAVCGRCGHTAFWHSGFGTGECQVRTGCDCHEFKPSVQASPAPERAALVEQIANYLEGVEWNGPLDAFYEHAVKARSQYDDQYRAMATEILAARKALRSAAALLKGEQS